MIEIIDLTSLPITPPRKRRKLFCDLTVNPLIWYDEEDQDKDENNEDLKDEDNEDEDNENEDNDCNNLDGDEYDEFSISSSQSPNTLPKGDEDYIPDVDSESSVTSSVSSSSLVSIAPDELENDSRNENDDITFVSKISESENWEDERVIKVC